MANSRQGTDLISNTLTQISFTPTSGQVNVRKGQFGGVSFSAAAVYEGVNELAGGQVPSPWGEGYA